MSLLFLCGATTSAAMANEDAHYVAARAAMVSEQIAARGIKNPEVLDAMRRVPRHRFVPAQEQPHAYRDTPLPIGRGQTISQPYIVALMTVALITDLPPGNRLQKVLEIGTGCGYQTAVLAPFVQHIYSVERIHPLFRRAQENLRKLGITNVSLRHSDGWHGWRSQAPFQGILCAAAPPEIPPELLDQLADGGRIVIPVGGRGRQHLISVTRDGDEFRRKTIAPVSFVPMLEGTET